MAENATEMTDAEIQRCGEIGEEFAEEVLDWVFEMSEIRNTDPIGVVFSMYIHFIHVLTEAGWTPEELAKEAIDHGRMQNEPESGNA